MKVSWGPRLLPEQGRDCVDTGVWQAGDREVAVVGEDMPLASSG